MDAVARICALPLDAPRKLTLVALAVSCDENGYLLGSVEHLSRLCSMTERGLRNVLRDLERVGLIRKEKRGRCMALRLLPIPEPHSGIGGGTPEPRSGIEPATPEPRSGIEPRKRKPVPVLAVDNPPPHGGFGGELPTAVFFKSKNLEQLAESEQLLQPRARADALARSPVGLVAGDVISILGDCGIPYHRCIRQVDIEKIRGWANAGVSRDVLVQAVGVARSRKGAEALSVGYLDPIVRQLQFERDNPQAAAVPRRGNRQEAVERGNREAVEEWLRQEGQAHA